MSGECDRCGEHALDCDCDEENGEELQAILELFATIFGTK